MRQAATTLSVVLAVIAAVALYAIAYETRQLEAHVHALEKISERAESDIAVARAELSHLSRPLRIEQLARSQGLAPATRQQFVTEDRLPRREKTRP